MTKSVFAASVVIIGSAIVLGACGNGDGNDPVTTTADDGAEVTDGEEPNDATEPPEAGSEPIAVDACGLVTAEESEAALGAAVGDAIPGDAPPFYSCAYETDSFAVLSVGVLSHESAEVASEAFQTSIDINDYPEIEGLGDRAYNARPVGDVTILIGTFELSVDVSASDDDEDLATAIDVARLAMDRLP